MRSILFITAVLFFCSCQRQAIPLQSIDAQNEVENAPKISFLQLKVSKNEGIYKGAIINRKEVVGILDTPLNRVQASEGQWLIRFLDNKENVLEQVILKNPLDTHLEFADDNGKFKTYSMKKKEATFFFRIQYNPEFARLEVEQILPNEKSQKLFSLSL